MTSALRIGIVGLGRLGRRHAENLAFRVPGARLVAAASPSAEERDWAAANLPGLATEPGLPELLARDDVDAVWLVTPTSFHADHVVASLESGRHVFCEKPLALEVADCDRVLAVAKARPKQVAMVGFTRRFDPAIAEAKRRIEAGELGKIFAIRCSSEDAIDPHGFFVRFAPTSGGIYLDCAIHEIDLVRWILDGAEARTVTAAGTRLMYPGLAPCGDVDTGFATVTFDGGCVATFHVSRTSHRGFESMLTIVGTEGALEIGRGLGHLPITVEKDGGRRVGGLVDFFDRFETAFLHGARAFVEAVRAGRPSPLGLDDARAATALAVRMREALVVAE